MTKISVKDLHERDVLAKPVENDNGNILLFEGAEINEDHIERLIKNGIDSVYVQDEDDNKKTDAFSIDVIKEDITENIGEIVEKKIRDDDDSEMPEIIDTAKEIIQEVVSKPEILNCLINVKRREADVYSHMLSVASLSTIMGIKAGFDETQLNDVATGALLHDIGLCDVGVPYENIEMDRMPAADKLNYRKHVIQGYELLQGCKWLSDTAKMIVLSHHEREDGVGYPFHKIGERIPVEVKLVSICDHFDELANGIGYRKRKVHEVVEYFRTSEAYHFNYELVSLVNRNIAWFPTNCIIITNEGETARVISQNKGLPDRPVIQIIKNADGTECTEKTIKDLTECLTVFIMDTVE